MLSGVHRHHSSTSFAPGASMLQFASASSCSLSCSTAFRWLLALNDGLHSPLLPPEEQCCTLSDAAASGQGGCVVPQPLLMMVWEFEKLSNSKSMLYNQRSFQSAEICPAMIQTSSRQPIGMPVATQPPHVAVGGSAQAEEQCCTDLVPCPFGVLPAFIDLIICSLLSQMRQPW